MVRQLSGCCLCLSVRTGTLILATLGIIGGIWTVVQNAAYAATSDVQMAELERQEALIREQLERHQISEQQYEMTMQVLQVAKSSLLPLLILGVVQAVIGLAISALLLFGALYRKHVLMLPYIVIQTIGLILTIVLAVIGFLVLVVSLGFGAAVFFGVIMFLALAIMYYLLLVVYSHYREIKLENEQSNNNPGFKTMA